MSGTTAATVGDIVNAAITELSQVPGQATQIYSTPRMQQYAQNAVLLELEEMWWPPLMYYARVLIDPLTGIPTTDIASPYGGYLDEYSDVCQVFHEGSNTPMQSLPRNINPYTMTYDGGNRGITGKYYIGPSALLHRPITVWPPADIGVVVYARHRPIVPMALTDRILLDRLMILYDVCWMYAVDDGTIPAQVNKFQVLAANRRKRIKAAYNTHSTPLDPSTQSHYEDTFFVLDQDPLA